MFTREKIQNFTTESTHIVSELPVIIIYSVSDAKSWFNEKRSDKNESVWNADPHIWENPDSREFNQNKNPWLKLEEGCYLNL